MKNNKPGTNNGITLNKTSNDVSTSTQRAQILSYLNEHGSATTLDIRNKLHILSPAPRILELRERGELICTARVNQPTPDGKSHYIAKYILERGANENAHTS